MHLPYLFTFFQRAFIHFYALEENKKEQYEIFVEARKSLRKERKDKQTKKEIWRKIDASFMKKQY